MMKEKALGLGKNGEGERVPAQKCLQAHTVLPSLIICL